MWMTSDFDDERLQSVVYFLSDTLRSILADGEELKESRCAPPVIGARASCQDIMSRLDDFRAGVNDLRGREAIMIAKLSRAREWAQMLREMLPEIRPEISVFLLGTVFCKDLQAAVSPDPQREFHGGGLMRQFLNRRLKSEPRRVDGDGGQYAYMVAGRVRIEYLMETCTRFLDTLEEYFQFYDEEDGDQDEALELDPVTAELELDDAGRAEKDAGLAARMH
jgi:hypothetical protein